MKSFRMAEQDGNVKNTTFCLKMFFPVNVFYSYLPSFIKPYLKK
uniref:Uncharacterized protein n=1 Tax=Anguilla anguilla TaxID=7936 RepID=A0A0E9RQ86_ANGAN